MLVAARFTLAAVGRMTKLDVRPATNLVMRPNVRPQPHVKGAIQINEATGVTSTFVLTWSPMSNGPNEG